MATSSDLPQSIGVQLEEVTNFEEHNSEEPRPVARPNKRVRSGSPGGASYPMCHVDNCKEDLSIAKDYHCWHKVWNIVEKHKKGEYTSIIHGKYSHEVTVATASFVVKYVILKNMSETRSVIGNPDQTFKSNIIWKAWVMPEEKWYSSPELFSDALLHQISIVLAFFYLSPSS